MKRLALILAMLFIPALARADSVWTYQGNQLSAGGFIFGDGGVLTGTVVLNNNDQVLAWSFSENAEGGHTFTNANSIGASFNLFNCTECSGKPFQGWAISMVTLNPATGQLIGGFELLSSYNPDDNLGNPYAYPDYAMDYVNNHDGALGQVWVVNNPGTWTEVSAVATPEPSSLLCLIVGIAVLTLAIYVSRSRPNVTTNCAP